MNVFKTMLVLVLIAITASCQKSKEAKVFTTEDITVIPKPVALNLEQGSFEFTGKTTFVTTDASQKEVTKVLIDKFKNAAGWTLSISEKAPENNFIQFTVDENLEKEAYKLEVNSSRVIISAS